VITTASIAGYEGQIGQIAYGSAKAGIIGMTIVAARDLAAIGVRVNCIAPGTMSTRAWDKAPASLRESLEAKVPFPPRFGHPEEFAALCEHLVTNRYVNGQVIRIDGAIRFDPK
jgi:NAD(P)-dependent dehydrogenase (short-subunit alcohol dehydrogenase family)